MVNQTATILDLPVELRDDIVTRLDIRDVVSLSLVRVLPRVPSIVRLMDGKSCKYLRTIMGSWQIWMKFAQEVQSQPQISRIEEPLEDFTAQELRDWAIRRHKIRHCFNSGSQATSHYIWGTGNAHKCVLLPGGRWLLFERSLGDILYADCDAPHPGGRPLIALEDGSSGCIKRQFVVWREPQSPRLTLKVAFLYWYNGQSIP